WEMAAALRQLGTVSDRLRAPTRRKRRGRSPHAIGREPTQETPLVWTPATKHQLTQDSVRRGGRGRQDAEYPPVAAGSPRAEPVAALQLQFVHPAQCVFRTKAACLPTDRATASDWRP